MWEKRGGRAEIIPTLPNAAFLGYSGESGVSAERGRGWRAGAGMLWPRRSRVLGHDAARSGGSWCHPCKQLESPIGAGCASPGWAAPGTGMAPLGLTLPSLGREVVSPRSCHSGGHCGDVGSAPRHSLCPQPGCPAPSRSCLCLILGCASSSSAVFIAAFIGKFYFPCFPYRETEARGKTPGPQLRKGPPLDATAVFFWEVRKRRRLCPSPQRLLDPLTCRQSVCWKAGGTALQRCSPHLTLSRERGDG